MNSAANLIDKLKDRTATIGIVGLGYVGLPLIDGYTKAGYATVGFDVDTTKIDALRNGQSYIQHIDADTFIAGISEGRCRVDSRFDLVAECDAIILCLPTPLDRYRQPDLSYVIQSLESILPFMHKGQAVSLESTTYPGTTAEQLMPRIEQAGFEVGTDAFLIYSPEREDPGNQSFKTTTIPKVVSGMTAACREVSVALYQDVVTEVVPVSSTQVAEMAKILENTYRAVNIALVNELKLVAEKMGIDIFEVIEAAATKPFGFTAFYPGPGLGGHCIPIDPFYLTWKAREFELTTRFIELAGDVNTRMPEYAVERVIFALNHVAKSVKRSRILVLGVAYKKNVDDMRESPSLVIIEKLRELGAQVDYSDPYLTTIPATRKFDLDMTSVDLSAASIRAYDCVLVCTDHDNFDWALIQSSAQLIVDTRGRYTPDDNTIFRA